MRELAKKYNGTMSLKRIKKEAQREMVGGTERIVFYMIDNDIVSDHGVQDSYKTHGNYFFTLETAERYSKEYIKKFKENKAHFNPNKLEDDEWFEITIRKCYIPVAEENEYHSFADVDEWDDWSAIQVVL